MQVSQLPPLRPLSSPQVTELFVDSKTRLELCAVDLDEKQQR